MYFIVIDVEVQKFDKIKNKGSILILEIRKILQYLMVHWRNENFL